MAKLVLPVIIPLLVWSVVVIRHMWKGRKLKIAYACFVLQDMAVAWLLICPNPYLYGMGTNTLLGIIVLLSAQAIFNLMVTAAILARLAARKMCDVPFDSGRRDFIRNSMFYPAMAGGVSLGGGFMENHQEQVLREIELPVKGLTAPDGYRIVQLSDIHLGPFFSLEQLSLLLEKASQQGGDILAVTGDLFDSDEKTNLEAVRILDGYAPSFPDGIYIVFGNHEYHRAINGVRQCLSASRICLLQNNAAQVPGKALWVAGVDYPRNKETFQEDREKYHRMALRNVPQGMTAILLAHHPECIDDGARSGIALTLTGHTHGGQFCILGQPLFPIFRYNRGLVKSGDSYGYVHSGNGSWFPCRIGCPPEIAVFTLRAAQQDLEHSNRG